MIDVESLEKLQRAVEGVTAEYESIFFACFDGEGRPGVAIQISESHSIQ